MLALKYEYFYWKLQTLYRFLVKIIPLKVSMFTIILLEKKCHEDYAKWQCNRISDIFYKKKLFWYSVDEWVYQISGLYRFMFMLGVRHIRTVKIENHLPREFWDIWSRVSRDDNYPTFSNHFFRVLGRKSSTSIALMLHMLIWASDRSLL